MPLPPAASAHSRREALRLASAAGFAVWCAPPLRAASDFWNRKAPGQWSDQEIEQLITHSPWAKGVNGDFASEADYTTGGAQGPQIGPGGQIQRPGADSAGQYQIGGGRPQPMHREPVVVRWESAQPILDALRTPLGADFAGRFVIGVTGLPIGVMERRGRANPDFEPDDNSPAARLRRMIEALSAAATLEARGREPVQPGMVRLVPGAASTYLFGFSKELLPLGVGDREVLFTLRTGLMSVKAKFEPREMLYHGKLAL